MHKRIHPKGGTKTDGVKTVRKIQGEHKQETGWARTVGMTLLVRKEVWATKICVLRTSVYILSYIPFTT